MFTLVCADMAAILFKALVGLEAEEEDACTLFLRRRPNTRAHSSLLGRECPAVVFVTRQGVVPSPTVSPFLIVNKPPPLLLFLLFLCSRALHLLVQHVLYRDTLCAEQTHSSQLCSAWYLSVVPA